MEPQNSVIEVPATPEYVLDVLLAEARWLMVPAPCTSAHSVLFTMDSPFEELREACDLNYDMNIILSPMDWFGLDFCEWRDALGTTEVYTVRDFCELIASLITMPRIPLVSICGQACQTASTFLTIRSLLQAAGAEAREIAPSTPLKEYTRCHTDLFLGKIAMLAPGALPDVEIDDGGKFRRQMMKDLMCLPLMIGFMIMKWFPALLFITLFVYLKLIIDSWGDEKAPNARVVFGELRTFRDLSELIAQRAVFQA